MISTNTNITRAIPPLTKTINASCMFNNSTVTRPISKDAEMTSILSTTGRILELNNMLTNVEATFYGPLLEPKA